MLEISQIRRNAEELINRLRARNFDGKVLLEKVLELDKRRKSSQTELDQVLSKINTTSREIGALYKSGDKKEANKLKAATIGLKEASKQHNDSLTETENAIRNILLEIPNVPHESVPAGKTSDDNEIMSQHGKIPDLGDNAKPHWDLAASYDIIDFELGSKITGSGFPVYKGKGAKLQRALCNFFLDRAIEEGYKEIQPPVLINEESGYATGQLPDKEGQMYQIGLDNLYLSPTAEVPLTNLYRDLILNDDDLPIKMAAYTPCFRREAGSYGKDVKGLNRLHQFDKVEIVQIRKPEDSYDTLNEMVNYVTGLLKDLELPYKIVKLCGGDIGFTAALTFDLEVFSAGQKRWLEVSSISNFETFQTNRLKLRFKNNDGKSQLLHTLNGSALAFPRIIAALLENNQTPQGIKIPKKLIPYTGYEYLN
ncbi:MAG TPA: serine--tRNA ligase [Flavobacteriales bacterium]|nr:serine--tRNA ligase [Flavobacteriales bacterium]HIN39221.1 serine--tRNA ligase [Flavobacteriales bacterium]